MNRIMKEKDLETQHGKRWFQFPKHRRDIHLYDDVRRQTRQLTFVGKELKLLLISTFQQSCLKEQSWNKLC